VVPSARTLAIGDIHGCLTALDALLAAVEPGSDDLLVTLGDYVDRGPNSRGVIDRLLDLDRRHRLVPLRGNHELMMLLARQGDFDLWFSAGGKETLASYQSDGSPDWIDLIPAAHWSFIETRCVPWFETETHIFSHAGVNPLRTLEQQDEYDLFWQPLIPGREHRSGKTLVFGHVPQRTGKPLNRGYLICLDTWVHGDGWLTCLEVETGRVWQANRAGESRDGWLGLPR
jgi:serine/threonine protein phosphatase 1